jgi:hypothetical protein
LTGEVYGGEYVGWVGMKWGEETTNEKNKEKNRKVTKGGD